MPIYDYRCPECSEEVESQLALSDLDKVQRCPVCGSYMKRVCGNSGGFRLKGNGWGADGYSSTLGDAENFRAGRKVSE